MKDLFRYFKSLIKRRDIPPSQDVTPDLPNSSGCIHFFWDSRTGDFNVILKVDEDTEMSAEILGMLMCYIGEGHMTQFLAESLRYWCDSPNKMEFYTDTLKAWNTMKELQQEERRHEEEKPLIDPSDVFRFKGNGNGN
jgi:hypothetical protein